MGRQTNIFDYETDMNQLPTTRLVELTAGVLTPSQSAARARCKHARPEAAANTFKVGDHDETLLYRDVNRFSR